MPARKGTGGHNRRRLSGRGPTPPAELRPGHPAQRRAAAAARRSPQAPRRPSSRRPDEATETVVGRNAVVEALRADVPATTLYVAAGVDADERVREAVAAAANAHVAVLEVSRAELDRSCPGLVHQGLALRIAPYGYVELDDLLATATAASTPALLVALDAVTDPHNLGAVIRSAAAFGAHGIVVPRRRAAGVTAAAWKASAGAAARLPVTQVTNLVRALVGCKDAGLFVVGLEAGGAVEIAALELATDPLVLVAGSEGGGLSRLVAQTCDLTVRIPLAAGTESLNVSVAAAVALADVAHRRRTGR